MKIDKYCMYSDKYWMYIFKYWIKIDNYGMYINKLFINIEWNNECTNYDI